MYKNLNKILFSDKMRYASNECGTTFIANNELGFFDPGELSKKVDPYSRYKFNTEGYRSKKFIENEELLISGCSFSFGIGVDEEMIWGVQVANYFNLSYSNISLAGSSPAQIVYNLFAYFKKYGNPKYLIILFPDLYRLALPSVIGKFVAKKYKDDNNDNGRVEFDPIHLYYNKDLNEVVKYSKYPHIIDEIVPIEVPIWLNIKCLHILEQYCEQSNIKLAWSFWDPEWLKKIYEEKKDNPGSFKYLIDSGVNFWTYDKDNNDVYLEECNRHDKLKIKYPNTFDIGGDAFQSRKTAHFGVHKHSHIAENFIQHIENNWIKQQDINKSIDKNENQNI